MAQIAYEPKFAGTDDWTTSVGNEEWIALAKAQVGVNYFKARTLEFLNKQDCVINVNGTQDVLIPANYGRDLENVKSFEIKTAGVEYICIIGY
jgi:hypothetical protein